MSMTGQQKPTTPVEKKKKHARKSPTHNSVTRSEQDDLHTCQDFTPLRADDNVDLRSEMVYVAEEKKLSKENSKEEKKSPFSSPGKILKNVFSIGSGSLSVKPNVWTVKSSETSEHKMTNESSKRLWFHIIVKTDDGYYAVRPAVSGFLEPKETVTLRFTRVPDAPRASDNVIRIYYATAPTDKSMTAERCYKDSLWDMKQMTCCEINVKPN